MSQKLRALVPMAFVKSVPGSVDFYRKLGFEVEESFTPDHHAEPSWVWLQSERAQIMLAKATEPVHADEQGVLFYIYCEDVVAKRADLEQKGMAVGPMQHPFHSPDGEFRVQDPDAYAIIMRHC